MVPWSIKEGDNFDLHIDALQIFDFVKNTKEKPEVMNVLKSPLSLLL